MLQRLGNLVKGGAVVAVDTKEEEGRDEEGEDGYDHPCPEERHCWGRAGSRVRRCARPLGSIDQSHKQSEKTDIHHFTKREVKMWLER